MPGRFPSFVAELPLTRRALSFAEERHAGQEREVDRAPFILHPLEVAQLLRSRGYEDEVVAAGVLHDVLENGQVEQRDLAERFGDRVARLVCQVSEPSGEGTWTERKHRLRQAVAAADADAVAIYAADKVAKSRELRMRLVATHTVSARDQERLEHYWSSLDLLELRLGDHPFVAQLRFELEALTLLPPSGLPALAASGSGPRG